MKVTERGFTALRETRHGLVAHNTNDVTIGLSLETYGEWAETELSGCLLQLIRPGDLVVDAGAHIGTHTIAFAKAVGDKGHVLACEPQLWANYYLCANVALNALDNVTALRVCLGASRDRVTIARLDQRARQNFGALPIGGEGDTVDVVPLDSFNLPACRLIKLDVEGAEIDVLRGAENTIARLRPIVFMEANKNTRETIEFLLRHSYQLHWFSAPFYNPDNFYGSSETHGKEGNGDVSILATPPGSDIGGLVSVLGPDDTWDAAIARWQKCEASKS